MANFIQRLFGGKVKKAGPVAGAPTFQIINGQLVLYGDNKSEYLRKGYTYNDIVYSIIKIQLDKIRVAPWAVYKVKDEKSLFRMKALQEGLKTADWSSPEGAQKSRKVVKEIFALHSKALELYDGDGRLNELMKWPNQDQSRSDFMEAACGFKLSTGDKYISAQLAGGGLNSGRPTALYIQPSDQIRIRRSAGYPFTAEEYELALSGNTGITKYTRQEMLHEKFWNPIHDSLGTQLYGLSPLKAALRRIQRSNESQLRGLKAFENGGADGVAYIDDPELAKSYNNIAVEQAGALKEKWDAEYSGAGNAGKVVWSPYKLAWAPIGLSPADLKLLETEQWDLRMLCNIYGVPSQLMNDPENKSFNNQAEGERALTSRCALPSLISHREAENRKLHTDWGYKGSNIIVDFDMTVFAELEEDKKEQTEWLSKAWWLTGNQKLTIQGEPESNEPVMGKIIIPTNMMLASQLEASSQNIDQDIADLEKSGIKEY